METSEILDFIDLRFLLVVFVVILVVILAGIRNIPAGYAAVVKRWISKRTGKVKREGLCWLNLFLLETLDRGSELPEGADPNTHLGYISLEFRTLTLEDSEDLRPEFNTSTVRIFATGKLQWCPDDGEDEILALVHWQWLDAQIARGLRTSVKSIVGAILGCVSAEESISSQKEIALFVNAVLCLDHKFTGLPTTRERFDWICKNVPAIEAELADHASGDRERSSVEQKYGIVIRAFDFDQFDYTAEVKKALEDQKVAERESKAEEAKRAGVEASISFVKKAIGETGASARDAMLFVERASGRQLSQEVKDLGLRGSGIVPVADVTGAVASVVVLKKDGEKEKK